MKEVEILSPLATVDFPNEWYDLIASDHFWFQWRLRAALRQARAIGLDTGRPLRALDVGGGTGVLRDQLEAATAWTVDLTDLNLSALQRSGRSRGRTLYYDIREVRSELVETYDVIVLFDVLEHIQETLPFVQALVRHLKPGGNLMVSVPALPLAYGAYDRAAGHVRRYDPKTLRAAFPPAHLEVQDLRFWGLLLVPLLLLRTFLQRGQAVPSEVIRAGFRPPSAFAHALLRAAMRLETTLPSPPLGSSLLLAGRRPSAN